MSTSKRVEIDKKNNKNMIVKIKALACFGQPDFTASKCLKCQGLELCAVMAQNLAVDKAVKNTTNTTKKSKKTGRKVTLADIFYLSIMQQSTGYIGLSCLAHDFGRLASLPNVKKAQKSIERSFAAHLTDVLLGKDKRYRRRGVVVHEGQGGLYVSYNNNQHVLDMLHANL